MKIRVRIRPPEIEDQREFIASARSSQNLHRPWLRAPSTPAAFIKFVERSRDASNLVFLICMRESGALAGVISITNIVLGPFRSGYLSYYAFSGYERQGLMREGLLLAITRAFKKFKLHRLEANIQPENAQSIALIKSCGFKKEGVSPRYLKISGRWRDHERWAILADAKSAQSE
jgi:[ribosomal protein S5]-alanine N-acetyltransferase